MQSKTGPADREQALLSDWQVIVLLAILAVISYVPDYAPVLYADDWPAAVERYVIRNLPWIGGLDARPLLALPFGMLHGVFGVNVDAFHAVLRLLLFLAAVQVCLLARKFVPRTPSLALLIAALVLVYPADQTRTWLIMLNVWVVVNLVLLYAWLLTKYVKSGKLLMLGASLLCLAASYGIYEAQIGVAVAWSLLLALVMEQVGWRRRVAAALCVGALSVVTVVHRLAISGSLGRAAGYEVGAVTLAPLQVLERLLRGFTILVTSWASLWGWLAGIGKSLPLLIMLLLAVVLCGMAAAALTRRHSEESPDEISRKQKVAELKRMAVLALTGTGLAVAGYVPIVLVFAPAWGGTGSRINLLASLGAALVGATLVGAFALVIGSRWRQVELIALAAAVPLLVTGVTTQIMVQREARVAWDEQTVIWQKLFALAPDLKTDTAVYFVLPGYERLGYAERLPLTFFYEATSALQVLYDNGSLKAGLLYPDAHVADSEVFLEERGIAQPAFQLSTTRTPYEQAVLVLYDAQTRELRLVQDLQRELHVGWATPGYAPNDRILTSPESPVELRHLVGGPVSPRSKDESGSVAR